MPSVRRLAQLSFTITTLGINVAAPTPVLIAFLVCDQIIEDAPTGKKTIVGVFDRITSANFPASHAPSSLYVKLIDCEGDYEVKIEFAQVSNQAVLLEMAGTSNSKSRHEYAEFVLPCPPLPLPDPGEYEFRLWMDNKFVGNVRIKASRQDELE